MLSWSVLSSAENYVMHLSLENPCIFLNFSFVALKFVMSVQAPRTRAVKNVRRHACSSIIKMCRDYPQLVLVCKCNCIMKSLASIAAGSCGIFSFFGYSLCFSSKKHSCCANGKVFYSLHLTSSWPHPWKICLKSWFVRWWVKCKRDYEKDTCSTRFVLWECLLNFPFVTCGGLGSFLSWRH